MRFEEVMKNIKQGERYVNVVTNDVVRSIEMTEYGLAIDLWQPRTGFIISGNFIRERAIRQIAAEEGLIEPLGYTRKKMED
ncbi:hypothetical protein ACQPUH_03350 [Clostridium perfringens]|uniref:hypothetical protein n=1 Tax=Clostridium perfringens TaxID=1502 RepID=UPI0018D8BE46|nr:hypothetical protein [Clostridium perfringens]MBI6006326.1 hypothetical protein [Clostridium perfringens]MDB2043058.1 hypothetical protein [Clostridium perfringens]MDB2053581.1 hypothetical protein [Clostridium perfringens]MDK0529043.1 hypothetical protein [Clostridium perfringens]MDK0555156.1 hypothetical protein [Clostridium perfringens]